MRSIAMPRALRADREGGARAQLTTTPVPIPPPQGGREQTAAPSARPLDMAAGICKLAASRSASRSLRMEPMTAAEATVASLVAHGLDTVYALPGVHND